MGRGAAGRLFKEPGITLEKVYVEEEVEREGSEIEECRQQPPVLFAPREAKSALRYGKCDEYDIGEMSQRRDTKAKASRRKQGNK